MNSFNPSTDEGCIGYQRSITRFVFQIEPYFHLNLITADPDDNKFVDCAFAGNAHYIVTNDRHFRVLQKIEFPTISTITAEVFKEWLATND